VLGYRSTKLKSQEAPFATWAGHFTLRTTDFSICSSILHSPTWKSRSCIRHFATFRIKEVHRAVLDVNKRSI